MKRIPQACPAEPPASHNKRDHPQHPRHRLRQLRCRRPGRGERCRAHPFVISRPDLGDPAFEFGRDPTTVAVDETPGGRENIRLQDLMVELLEAIAQGSVSVRVMPNELQTIV